MARLALDGNNAPRLRSVCPFFVILLDRATLLAASISGLYPHDDTVFRSPNPVIRQTHSAV